MLYKSRKVTKTTFALVALCSLLLSFCLSVSALPALPDISGARTVYLWNAEHDKVIVSKSEDDILFPASTVKIMTGLVAIDLVGERLDEKVTLTEEMLADKKGTSMQLRVGEVVSFRDLLYGAICGGFNDATTALAVASAGSMAEFVKKMNDKATDLGTKSTHYTNPTGWHDDAMVSTLEDTAIIAKAAMKNELYVTVSSAQSYDVPPTNMSQKFTVHNRNGLVSSHYAYGYYNRRAEGLIAGMTDEGGYCVATAFEYDGLTYLCIVMGGEEINETVSSYAIANSLISYTINYYGELGVIDEGDRIVSVPVRLAVSRTEDEHYMLPLTVSEDISLLTPYDSTSLESVELRPYLFFEELSAPIKEGEVVGGVDIFIDGVYRGNADLCASEDVEANGILSAMEGAKNILTSRAFIVFFICFIVLFSIYFFIFELNALRKKDKKIKIDRIY